MVPSYHDTMVPWHHGTMAPWYHGPMESRRARGANVGGGAVCGSVEGVEGAPLLVRGKNRAFPLHDQFEFKLLDPTRFRAAKCARTPPRRRPAQCYSISQQQKFNFRMRPRIRERAHSLRTEVRVEERGSTGALKERKPAQRQAV